MSEKRKTKIAIIQLTRIGDLIQTMQAVRQLKYENEDIEYTLIARKKFASGISFLLETVFDKIHLIDIGELLEDRSFSNGVERLTEVVATINQSSYDISVNLSFNKSSSYLNSLINSKSKLGLYRNNKTEISVYDSWSQYIFSNVMGGSNNPFNLVDIFRFILGCKNVHILTSENSVQKQERVIIHPFASNRKKRWGTTRWSELIYKLSKDLPNTVFEIVGSPADQNEAAKILNAPVIKNLGSRVISRVGQFSIKDVYQSLSEAKLFIGHDSMVSHLAAETLTPSIVLSLGMVRPNETTPYNRQVLNFVPRNNCFPCNVETECSLLSCHSSLHHQVISTYAFELYKSQDVSTLQQPESYELSPFHLNNVQVLRNNFDQTGLYFEELTATHTTIEDSFKNFYTVIYQYYLRGVDVNIGLPDITGNTAKELVRYIDGANYLYELLNFGVKYCNEIIKKSEDKKIDYSQVQADVNKLAEIDNLCNVTKSTYPHLASIVDFFYVNKANSPGNNLSEIAKSNLLCYYDASNLVAVLSDFIKKSTDGIISVTDSAKEV